MSKECKYCHTDNDDSAVKCKCGADLCSSGTSDTAAKTSVPVLTIKEKKSGKEIAINGNCTIGREGDIESEFFSNNMYISREHCRVILENGEFKIEHLSSKNPTKIDGIPLGKGIKKIIRNGSSLTIADLDFNVSISSNIPVPEPVPAVLEKFIIICPKCGVEYEVDGLNAAIKECKNCDDLDKYEISNVKAAVRNAN